MRYWYYLNDGQQIGPVSEDDLTREFATGRLGPETMVWTKELKDWTLARDIENMVSAEFRPPPVPVQPPALPCQAYGALSSSAIGSPPQYTMANQGHVDSALASRWKRLGGSMIDGLISMAIIIPVMLPTGYLQRLFEGEKITLGEQLGWIVASWALFLGLNGYLLFHKGQTIGKLAVKTKIVDLEGRVPSFGKLLVLRYFILSAVNTIPCINIIVVGLMNPLFIFGKERRCLHDYIAGTRVVNA